MSRQLTFRIFREDLTRWHRHKRAMFPDYATCCTHRDIYTYPVATMASTTDIDSYVFEGTPEENKDAHLEKFKHDLNDELTRTFPTTPRPYDNVQVLLLCWEEADGNNHEDVVTFRNFLKNTFHYQTQIYNKRPRPPHPRYLLRRRGRPLHRARDLSRRQLQHPNPAPKIFHPAARDTAPRPRPAQSLPEAFAPHHGGPWQDEAGLHGGRAVPWLEHRMRGVGSGSSAWAAMVHQSYRLPLRYFYQAPSPPTTTLTEKLLFEVSMLKGAAKCIDFHRWVRSCDWPEYVNGVKMLGYTVDKEAYFVLDLRPCLLFQILSWLGESAKCETHFGKNIRFRVMFSQYSQHLGQF